MAKKLRTAGRLVAGLTILSALIGAPAGGENKDPSNWRDLIDMSRADVSSFSLKMINDGAEVGGMTYGWVRDGGRYVISDRTEMQPNILETAEGVIDASTLLPISIGINFAIGETTRKYDVTWKGSELSGGVLINQPNAEARSVDFTDPDHPPSALRLSIFGLIAGLPLGEGFSVKMPWYNTLSNTIEKIELIHDGVIAIDTPAGTFQAHKIDLKGGTPENIIYVSTSLPQKIVRIDVVGQPMHFLRLP